MRAGIEALLTEAAWLTHLARSLAGDPAEAADAVQETWLAAMRSPPDPERPVRPWLRRVLVNTLRMRHRSSRRRESNEAISELLVESPPTPEQLVERARTERRLGDLVLALAEPHRSTVLLRYREGLTAEAIAKQQGIPAATVRTRLKTALDQLRDAMDGDPPARKWRALFVPGVATNRSLWRRLVMAKTATKGGVAVAVALALALLVGSVIWSRRGGDGDGAGEAGRRVAAGSALLTRRAAAGGDPTSLFAQPGAPAKLIAGRVTLAGKAFAGATVHLADATTRTPLAEVTSAADGRFVLGARAALEYVVVATAPGRTAAMLRVDLRAAIDASQLELALAACTSKLTGTVHDASGGVIAHARVTRDEAPWPAAETGANGHYELCLPFGHAVIDFAAAGYAGRTLGVDIDGETRQDIALVPEATIAGTVIDGGGKPVAGAWVSIEPAGSQPSPLAREYDAAVSGFSAGDGTFRIEGVAPGSSRIIGFAPGAFTARPVGVVAIAGQVIEGVVVRVDPAARLTGIVVAGERPVGGVAIAMRIGNRDLFGTVARTQPDGRFEIERVPPGELTLTVSEHSVLAPSSVRVDVATPLDVRIQVTELGTITGHVLRAGQPVADAQVDCDRRSSRYTRSDRRGRYACTGFPPGRYALAAAAADGAWGVFDEPLTLVAGQTVERDIELAFGAELCGRVVDEAGRPFGGVDVRVVDHATGDSASDLSGDDGRFCGRFLTGGRYELVALAAGHELEPTKPLAPVAVASPDGRAMVEVAFRRPNLAITGTVTDSSGAPVPDAIVRVIVAGGQTPVFRQSTPATIATTDAAGAFRIAPIGAGTYSLVASGRDGAESVLPAVEAGASDLAITLDPAGAVEGRIVGFTGTPSITGILLRGSRSFVRPQIDGARFRADGLSPGVYIFTANTGLGESAAREVTVAPGRTTAVELESLGTGTIAVKLVDFKTRAPVAGMSCIALARAGDQVGNIYTPPADVRRSDAAGRFVIDPAPTGEIYVGCNGNGADAVRLISLAPRQRLELEMPVVTSTRPRELGFVLDLVHRVEELVPNGAAARAGLLLGDRVVTVDGRDVAQVSPTGVLRLVANRPAAELGIERAGTPVTVRLVVPE